jgi:type II secretory pathway pseudopilin PulG
MRRHRGLRSPNYQITNRKLQIPQRGYMMITLMLALALITIALLAVLPEIGQQIKRDREQELRHRGTAYMRAIQHFYKKNGSYPLSIAQLENTNNIRYLRKRYTDPMNRDPATGKERDFKLLHQQDISLNGGVFGQTPGQSLLPGQGGLQGQGGFGGAQGGFGGMQGGFGGVGVQPGGLQPTGNAGAQNPPSGDSGDTSSGNSSSGSSSSGNPSDTEGNSNSSGSSSSNSNARSNSGSGFNGPTFGGGPILGVASTSKAKSIRVFYGKNHYNDWLFIYVPMADRGGLLTGPVNPGVQTGIGGIGGVAPGQVGGMPGQGQGLGLNVGQPQNVPAQSQQNPSPTSPQN